MIFYTFTQFCHSKGGYLAEITSQEEQDVLDFILPSVTNAYHWIGLNDLANPGNFKWQNSYAPATYTNWRSDHPDRTSACAFLTPYADSSHYCPKGYCWVAVDCLGYHDSGGYAYALCEGEN